MGWQGRGKTGEERKGKYFTSHHSAAFLACSKPCINSMEKRLMVRHPSKKTDTCAKPFSLTPNLQKLEEHQFFNWNSRASDHKTIFLLGASWHAVVLSFCVFLIVKKHQWNLMAPVQTELVRRAQKHQGHRAGDNTHCDYLYTSKLVPV